MKTELTFDEAANLCAAAAIAKGNYPPELAELAGEMTLWLERHRLPGMEMLANWLDNAPPFDAEKAAPKHLENGMFEFPDPFIAGMFLVDSFDQITLPARIPGPSHGVGMMTPFFAMAAQKRSIALEIVFIAEGGRQGEASRLSYRDGKSIFEGNPAHCCTTQSLGISKPEFMAKAPLEPLEDSISVDTATIARLSPRVLN